MSIFFPHEQFKSFIAMLMLISSDNPSKNPLPVSSHCISLLIWKCVLCCCPPVLIALFPFQTCSCVGVFTLVLHHHLYHPLYLSFSFSELLDSIQQSLSSPPVLHTVFFLFFFFRSCRKDFEELFDVIITNALKPGFFSLVPQQRPFRTLGE